MTITNEQREALEAVAGQSGLGCGTDSPGLGKRRTPGLTLRGACAI